MTSRAYPNAGNKGTHLKIIVLLIPFFFFLIFFANIGHLKHQHRLYPSVKAPIRFS